RERRKARRRLSQFATAARARFAREQEGCKAELLQTARVERRGVRGEGSFAEASPAVAEQGGPLVVAESVAAVPAVESLKEIAAAERPIERGIDEFRVGVAG